MADPIITVLQLLLPHFSLGIALGGLLLFWVTISRFPEHRYYAVFLLTLLVFGFVLGEIVRKYFIFFGVFPQATLYLDFSQQFINIFHLVSIPYFLREYALPKGRYHRFHNALLRWAFGLAFVIATLALFHPDWFVSISETAAFSQDLVQGGRGQRGPLHSLRDIFLLLLIFYAAIAMLLDYSYHKKSYFKGPLVWGLLMALFFFVSAGLHSLLGFYLLPLPEYAFSRVLMGFTVFMVFIYWGIFRDFLVRAKLMAKAKDDLQASERQLAEMVFRDELTGLANRRAFMRDLRSLLQQKRGGDQDPAALIVFDLDHFMDLNESYGHEIGDQILMELGKIMPQCLPDRVEVYRMGGDEFALLVPSLTPAPKTLVDDMQKELQKGIELRQSRYPLRASYGIAIVPRDGREASRLLRSVYTALKQAKQESHPVVEVKSDLLEQSLRRIKVVSALGKSIAQKEFYLNYQPILSARGEIEAAEVLVRWDHPSGYAHNPGEYIPIAESAGLMGDLGWLIFEKFVYHYGRLVGAQKDFHISINLSPYQIFLPNFCQKVVELFYSHGVDNRIVQFEITESAFMDKFVRAVETLECLRFHGFRIALDDFGTGYSSLQYLQHLPVDVIKIDRSFTKKIPGNPKAEAVLRTILDLGRRLNLEIIAEGVEAEEQFRYLKRQGSSHFQGYYFYKPMGIHELLALLQRKKGEAKQKPPLIQKES